MLALRPSCEHCDKTLLPESRKAMICSYECTFCKDCVKNILQNVCPNCGGGFCPRPIRPARRWKGDNYLISHPATDKVTYQPVDVKTHQDFSKELKLLTPEKR
jgi:hypothetical protein